MDGDFIHRLFRKRRRYPIKRDESGRSARRRCFDLFDEGSRPSEAAPIVGVSLRTACRYFQDWKKLPRCLEDKYKVVRSMMMHNPGFSESLVKDVNDILGLTLEEVRSRMEEPWGLKRLLKGKWPEQTEKSEDTPAHVDKYKQWSRLKAAISIIYLYEVRGVPIERIVEELEKLDKHYHRPKGKNEEAGDGP